jgi:hypothetical protein
VISEQMIERSELVVRGGRVSVPVRMPWYRALPMSSVGDMIINLDGHEVPAESITWTCEGRTYTREELTGSWQTWWFPTDTAYMTGDLPEGYTPGESAQVTIQLGLYIPYINAGTGILKIVEKDSKSLPVRSE